MKVNFIKSRHEAKNIITFYFKPEEELDYTAGQYIELYLPHPNEDDRGHKRWFTLSSSPLDEYLTITTKFSEPSSSFKQALLDLKTGDELKMLGPMGDFVLPKIVQTPLIFVAGGIGLTPFHSILKWLHQTGESRPIKFIYGVTNEDEIIFMDEFNEFKQHISIVVDHPSDSWGGERGRISAELIMGISRPTKESMVFVSGPEPMVEAIGDDLIKHGLKRTQLVQDFFPNYTKY